MTNVGDIWYSYHAGEGPEPALICVQWRVMKVMSFGMYVRRTRGPLAKNTYGHRHTIRNSMPRSEWPAHPTKLEALRAFRRGHSAMIIEAIKQLTFQQQLDNLAWRIQEDLS